MSMPTSAIAAIAAGLISLAGSEPPEHTATRSPARWRSQPAAICERPALCTQRNSTAGDHGVISVGPCGTDRGEVADQQRRRASGTDQLHHDERRGRRRFDPGERVRQRAGDRDRRVGEARRRREPVGAADPHADGERHGAARARCGRSRGSRAAARTVATTSESHSAPDDRAVRRPVRRRAGRTSRWRRSLRGRRRRSGRRRRRRPSRVEIVAEQPVDQRDDRVEVGAGHRAEHEDQRDERASGRGGVLQQLEPDVVRRQPLAMIPDPITATIRKPVPSASATRRRRGRGAARRCPSRPGRRATRRPSLMRHPAARPEQSAGAAAGAPASAWSPARRQPLRAAALGVDGCIDVGVGQHGVDLPGISGPSTQTLSCTAKQQVVDVLHVARRAALLHPGGRRRDLVGRLDLDADVVQACRVRPGRRSAPA